jgi:hypothetical protein
VQHLGGGCHERSGTGGRVRGQRVLVVYATRSGGTAAVAQVIGEALQDVGAEADVSRVGYARRIDRYDAVLIGSPLHGREWHEEAIMFMRKHKRTLRGRPVWLFHVGTALTGESSRLPPEVMSIARRIGVIGVLNVMADVHVDTEPDVSMAGGIANIEAVDQLAEFVADTLNRRRAV